MSVHVSLTVGRIGTEPIAKIVVGGVDVTKYCRGFKATSSVDSLTSVWLDLFGVTLDIQADVDAAHVRVLTPDQQDAQDETDAYRARGGRAR